MKHPFKIQALMVFFMILFLWGAWQQAVLVNTDMTAGDQGAYMFYAKRMSQTNYQYVGGRNRMPIYPSLMALFYHDEMTDHEFFQTGKFIGIALALLVAALVLFLFRKAAPSFDAYIAVLVALFTVFAYKSPYFQAEILYYGISFILFYLLFLLVKKPTFKLASAAGVVAGVGFLTKASVLPAILLACVCLLIGGIWQLKSKRNMATSFKKNIKRIIIPSGCIILLLSCFFIIVFPYLQTSKERFGQYFYNVNSTFYMWYDSWEQCKQGTRAHGDRKGWPEMPEDQIPSFRKYISDHSFGAIAGRFVSGLAKTYRQMAQSYGYVEFLVIYAITLVLLFGQNFNKTLFILKQTNLSLLLFTVGYFAGYTLLYAWYTPIASENRFILTLFLPILFIFLKLISRAQMEKLSFICFGKTFSASIISGIVLICFIAYLITIFPYRISIMYGGG